MKKIKDFGRKTNSILGAVTVICGFVMMWASSLGGSTTQSSLTTTLEAAVDIDATRPSLGNSNKLVVASGNLRGDALLEDDFLVPQSVVRLVRRVEMFQWVEDIEDESNPSSAVNYSLKWAPKEVDFFRFREPTGHENPVMKVQPLEKRPETVFFGSFDGARILDAIEVLSPLQLGPDMLKDRSYAIENNKLLIKRESGTTGPSLGDIRVWYEVISAGDYTVLARQVDERFLIASEPSEEVFIQRGRYTAEELFGLISQDAKEAYTGMLFIGAVLTAFGLFSVLKPYAANFDLNPKIDIRGVPAVALVSAGISCALMGIFMVLSLVG